MKLLESSTLDPALVIAFFSLVGSLIVNVVQFIKVRGENKKSNAESSSILVEVALKLNQQEVNTLRILQEDAYKRYTEEKEERHKLEIENETLREKLAFYESKQDTIPRDNIPRDKSNE